MKEQEYTVQFSAGETYGIITSKPPLARPRVCKAQSFENIEPCKTAASAVLLRPLCGVMV